MDLYTQTAFDCSRRITHNYSTSFTLGIRALAKRLHDPIYGIYGLVRYGDEIVDTLTGHDQAAMLADFERHTFAGIEAKVSSNPVLHAFQYVVNEYAIPHELIKAFFHSMAMDLNPLQYDESKYTEYIYGSAEVVGLMCLCVFVEGDRDLYQRLKPSARSLGAAFQKINFLRDLRADYHELGRVYFPGVDISQWDNGCKADIEADIQRDFDHGYEGIRQLPKSSRWGVYLAYIYYLKLFHKVRRLPANRILHERVRIPNARKAGLLVSSYVNYQIRGMH